MPKETCIFLNEEVLTLRFSLDKAYLEDSFAKFDQPLLLYEGPSTFESGLSCLNCKTALVGGSMMVKGAPSENWREVVELW